MFKTIGRIINWCGEFKGKLYIGFIFSFLSNIFAAMPVMVAAYTVGMLMEAEKGSGTFDRKWIGYSILIILGLVFFRFLFDYLRAKFQEAIGYELIARDRLAVGDALKRVSLGYFQQMNTGNILSSITTGIGTLETMGIRMINSFIGGYLNFLVVFLCLCVFSPVTALIALAAAAVSFVFLLVISWYSTKNAPVEAKANRDMTGSILEYARGLSVVKSFGQSGASMQALSDAVGDSRRIHLKIEWGFIPSNSLHLLALKCGSVGLALASFFMTLNGQMDFSMMLIFVFFSFEIFASVEPISDSAHVLSIIEDAMDQLDALKKENAGKTGVCCIKTEAQDLCARAGVQFPGSAAQDGLIHSIFDAGSPVNRKYVKQTEIRKNDPPHGGDSGFFGAVSYLQTIRACKKVQFHLQS